MWMGADNASRPTRMRMQRYLLITLIAALALLAGCKPHAAPVQSHASPIVFAKDGAWNWIEDPRAVHVEGTRNRTYAGWVTSRGDLQIGAYDHATGHSEIVTLKHHWEVDDHDSPSILVLPDRRLMVFYTRHNLIGLYCVTAVRPEDISAWDPEITVVKTSRTTYSQPVYLADEKLIYVFWRGESWKPTFATSPDGKTWSTPRILVEQSGREATTIRPYFKIASDGKSTIHIAFTDGHPRDEPTNSIYYMKYARGAFYKADGTRIGTLDTLPIQHRDSDIVYDARPSYVRAWIWDIASDASGNPVIAYAQFPNESDHRYHYAYWLGDRWLDTELVAAGGWFPQTPSGTQEREPHYSGGIALDHADPSIVYLSRQVDGMFEIERWTTNDRGKTWRSTAITSKSSHPNMRPMIARNVGGSDEYVLWMRGDYVFWTDYHTGIMLLEPGAGTR
jgi:hypothetical protein